MVSVIQARDLEANDVTGSLDSYVKLWLAPSRNPKSQTKVSEISDIALMLSGNYI